MAEWILVRLTFYAHCVLLTWKVPPQKKKKHTNKKTGKILKTMIFSKMSPGVVKG